jgi:hypothetical protein
LVGAAGFEPATTRTPSVTRKILPVSLDSAQQSPTSTGTIAFQAFRRVGKCYRTILIFAESPHKCPHSRRKGIAPERPSGVSVARAPLAALALVGPTMSLASTGPFAWVHLASGWFVPPKHSFDGGVPTSELNPLIRNAHALLVSAKGGRHGGLYIVALTLGRCRG